MICDVPPSAGISILVAAAPRGTKHRISIDDKNEAGVLDPPILQNNAVELTKCSPVTKSAEPPGSRPLTIDTLYTEASA